VPHRPAYRHAGVVIARVLLGTERSQLDDGAVPDYRPSQSWNEPWGTRYPLIVNPGATGPAHLLAAFVAPSSANLKTVEH